MRYGGPDNRSDDGHDDRDAYRYDHRYDDRVVDTETIGALVARLRGEHGITQLRLAARLCAAAGVPTVTRTEVSRWEREERIPSGYWLGWLAAVLEVPLEDLERAAGAARRRRLDRRVPPRHWVQLAPGVYGRAS